MSFTLMDLGSENFEIRASVWSWKAALEIIKKLDVVSEGKLRQMGYNATGTTVTMEEAQSIASGINAEFLSKMSPGSRIFADLSITNEPDDGTMYRDDDERWKNYSADYEWLREFTEFCSRSKGFQVF